MKCIYVNSPEHLGAPMPKFDPKKINESKFEHVLRPKMCSAEYDNATNIGSVEWLAQEADYFSDALSAEIVRAFKANGAKPGCVINVKYGQRDYGLRWSQPLTVE